MFPEPTELLLMGYLIESTWTPKSKSNTSTKNQLADILTKGNFIRDEWNHLLSLFNISHFSSTVCSDTMAKRSQQDSGEERVTAKSRPMMNLVSRNSVRDPDVLASSFTTGQCVNSEHFFEYIYHIGCAINLHSITNSGLIPGEQNLSKRQTVFFLLVDPMDKEHKDPNKIDLEAPRLAWYHQKKWKKHQNTV